jgi:hypothetical protein
MTADPTASASAAALDTYRRYWDGRVSAQVDPKRQLPQELLTYAIDTALADEEDAIVTYRAQGIAWRGRPTLAPTVTSVSLGDTPKVTIQDCVDTSNWTPVFASTGRSARAPGQLSRVVVDSLATVYAAHWVIRTATAYRNRGC